MGTNAAEQPRTSPDAGGCKHVNIQYCAEHVRAIYLSKTPCCMRANRLHSAAYLYPIW